MDADTAEDTGIDADEDVAAKIVVHDGLSNADQWGNPAGEIAGYPELAHTFAAPAGIVDTVVGKHFVDFVGMMRSAGQDGSCR